MKKAVADHAPTLPVKVINFQTNPHSTRILHTEYTFPGIPLTPLCPRGINCAEINARRGGGSL